MTAVCLLSYIQTVNVCWCCCLNECLALCTGKHVNDSALRALYVALSIHYFRISRSMNFEIREFLPDLSRRISHSSISFLIQCDLRFRSNSLFLHDNPVLDDCPEPIF